MRIEDDLYRRLAFKLSDEERTVALDLDAAELRPGVAVFRMKTPKKIDAEPQLANHTITKHLLNAVFTN